MPDYYFPDDRVQDELGATGTVRMNLTEGGDWFAFVEWDNGETDWMNHDALTRPEAKET